MGDLIGGVVFFVVCTFGVSLPCFALADWSCKSQAKVMGMSATYGPIQGCMIEHKPGKWVPLESYRALD